VPFRASRFHEVGILALGLAAARGARAQACCAGASAITPARLGLHEDALVGMSLHGAGVTGSFSEDARYAVSPTRNDELDFSEDAMGALRILPRLQGALLVPLVETYRRAGDVSSGGGGIGDVNVAARYDFFLAGQSLYWPGIAVLAGVTLPTGRPPESATHWLATDATGIGAVQGTLGVAMEQTAGSWLVSLSGLVAKRAPRSAAGVRETLGASWTALLSAAYTFENDAALATIVSYTTEANPTIEGTEVVGAGRRSTTLGLSALLPFSDTWRATGGVTWAPPLSGWGKNSPATLGFTLTLVHAWL
jgi:hypothetical protein